MAHLIPFPLGRLAARVLRELEAGGPVLDLPASKIVRGTGGRDYSVRMHQGASATVLGPAAGPHTQLAQNIALGFLGGCRVFELKTVQVMDELKIPRPCIDLRTVGFNVEWSQELKLEESLEEYVKASMLLEVMVASGLLKLDPGFDRFVFDLSVGYDLKGIQGERVQAFLAGMKDATKIIDRLRPELPKAFRDLRFRTCISDTLTLSTFHGCPPKEIEGITRFLMEHNQLHCVVKLNPTLNGPKEARRIFHEVLGYRYRIPDAAFANDPTFEQAVELVTRLEETARQTGRGLGVKFSNTLVVENEGDYLPKEEKLSYLSGQPLHVLAMTLVQKFRGVFGDRLPVSFSAGIDKQNFPDAATLGLVPVTVCSDLLRPGGYGRLAPYFEELGRRMDAVGAKTMDDFVLRGQGRALDALKAMSVDAATRARCEAAVTSGAALAPVAGEHYAGWVSHARLLNATTYVGSLLGNRRYAAQQNAKAPNKLGSHLALFDCVTCDKCVPVCPNHANFSYVLPKAELPVVRLSQAGGQWVKTSAPPLKIDKKRQFANFADFCNECGNCDIFCPEDGGPYVVKPRFFGSPAQFARWKTHDGFFVSATEVLGRFQGRDFRLAVDGERAHFEGQGFAVVLHVSKPEAPLSGTAEAGVEVDLTYFHIMRWLQGAVLAGAPNYVNA